MAYPKSHGASLVAQAVKHMTTRQESWVQSLGWEEPLEKRKATHFNFVASNLSLV